MKRNRILPKVGGLFLGLTFTLDAQTIVPSRTEWKDGKVSVVFPLAPPVTIPIPGGGANVRFSQTPVPTTLGKVYRIERSLDQVTWTAFPETIYGFGQIARYVVADAPFPNQTALPPSSEPRPAISLSFMVIGFPDGTSVASWTGLDGSTQKAYLPNFSLVYGGANPGQSGQVMQEMISAVIPSDGQGSQPYELSVWSWSSTKTAALEMLTASPTEQTTLSFLTSQATWVRDQMTAKVDWKLANPGLVQAEPPKLFDDKGQPTREFYRVVESTTDSNFDHVSDHLQFGPSQNPFDMDSDNDGIPNGYDRNLWPQATYPATYALLSNILINEVLLSNEHTVGDEDNEAQDYIELYNPTNQAINISGWYLSDSFSNNPVTGVTKWSFPTGTVIESGQFLVVWASGKNRTSPYSPLHTSFNIRAGSINPAVTPEPIVLARANPAGGSPIIVDSFSVGNTSYFGPQRGDISFGRYPTSEGLKTGYMIKPTPGDPYGLYGPLGEHNVSGAMGFTDAPSFTSTSHLPGLYENTTVQAAILPASTGGTIHFTTNSSTPSRYSELYSGPISAARTKVVRAVAIKEGYLPSSPITRSFLFKEDILGTAPAGTPPTDHQGAKDSTSNYKGPLQGYPTKTSDTGYPLIYEMDAATIAAKKAILSQELNQVPVVSIVCPVPEFFDYDAGGLYANSEFTAMSPDPQESGWERRSSFEFVEPNQTNYKQINVSVLMTGNSSLWQDMTRKHNLRIKFNDEYTTTPLDYKVFSDFTKVKFEQLHLKNTTQDSWSNNWGSGLFVDNVEYNHRDIATYTNENWGKAVHKAMGHDGTHYRWVHLFINGIYWGPHQLTERIDDDFVNLHESIEGLYTFDVIRQGELAMAGDTAAWLSLKDKLATFKSAPPASKTALYQELTQLVDINNYIDYLMVHWYCNVNDWGDNNWRAARKREGGQWKFYIWDTEFSFQPGQQTNDSLDYESLQSIMDRDYEVLAIHDALRNYPAYQTNFSQRIKKHFFVDPLDPASGCLAVAGGVDRAVQKYDQEMLKFAEVIHSESARWGHMAKTVPYGKDTPTYLSGKPFGDWTRATTYVKNVWIPQRRQFFLGKMQQNGLYQP